jgi:hypothetical protein
MPRAAAPDKRSRAQASTEAEPVPRAVDMEEPLGDAIELVLAVELMASALSLDHDPNGTPIGAVARALMARLRVVERIWLALANAGDAAAEAKTAT